jgi:hypothetical protein
MSATPAVAEDAIPAETYAADKRTHHRYPITLELEYKVLHRGRVECLGFGRTLNMSSGGVLIDASQIVRRGRIIELVVNWPFLLEGVCPLKLIVRGRIVRTEGRAVAVKAKHHEFRTAGIRVDENRTAARPRSLAR